MQVKINVNMCDKKSSQVREILYQPFKLLANHLSKEYSGEIEHLWIDFELIDRGKPPYPFRFQKRVSGRNNLTGIDFPDSYNVGHYSVKPDFAVLLQHPQDNVVKYALQLIYESTNILVDKKKRLGGFDAETFRSEFLNGCDLLGYKLHVC